MSSARFRAVSSSFHLERGGAFEEDEELVEEMPYLLLRDLLEILSYSGHLPSCCRASHGRAG